LCAVGNEKADMKNTEQGGPNQKSSVAVEIRHQDAEKQARLHIPRSTTPFCSITASLYCPLHLVFCDPSDNSIRHFV